MPPLLQWKSSIIYSECVFVALGIQHAKHMSCILLLSVARQSKQYFSHDLINSTIFKKTEKVIE